MRFLRISTLPAASHKAKCRACIFTGAIVGGVVVLAPFIVPVVFFDDGYARRLQFSIYPYANGVQSYQLPTPEIAKMRHNDALQEAVRVNWAARIASDEGNDFRGLNRTGVQFKLEHTCRWGINSNWHWLAERLPYDGIDEALLGDTKHRLPLRAKRKPRHVHRPRCAPPPIAAKPIGGFNFTYGGVWFPMQPLIVSAYFDAGTLGHAGVLHAGGSVGAIYRGWELFAGYDFLRIGGTNLQGTMIGGRWWF
jgi:hypothetical protein